MSTFEPQQPGKAKADATPRRRWFSGEPPVQSPRVWWLTALFALGMLLAAEAALRSGGLWSLPLEYLLTHRFDTGTRAAQRVHAISVPGLGVRVPAAGPADTRTPNPGTVLLLGNSTAIAVMELPWYGADGRFERPPIAGATEILDLTVNASCYAEQLLFAEQAITRGYVPELAVVFTWPYCLGNDANLDVEAALRAERVPLTSDWLGLATPPRSLTERLERAWVDHVAVGRYRYFVNAWLRSRADAFLRGRFSLSQPLRPTDRSKPFARPWDADPIRYRRLVGPTAERLDFAGPGRRHLEHLLGRLTVNGSRVLLVEAPWTPLVSEALAGDRERYRREMAAAARRHGVAYVDPNRELSIASTDANDLLHVTHAGGRRYYAAVQAAIEAQLRR